MTAIDRQNAHLYQQWANKETEDVIYPVHDYGWPDALGSSVNRHQSRSKYCYLNRGAKAKQAQVHKRKC